GGYPITTAPTETYDISGSLTQTRGAHTLKAGGTWDLAKNYSLRNRARTSLTANGGGSFDNVDSIVELLLGRFDTASRSFGSTARNMSQNAFGVYVNDDWKATSRVTISLGLRYDIVAPLKEANNLASLFVPGQGLVQLGNGLDQLYPVDKNNFGPRAGIA